MNDSRPHLTHRQKVRNITKVLKKVAHRKNKTLWAYQKISVKIARKFYPKGITSDDVHFYCKDHYGRDMNKELGHAIGSLFRLKDVWYPKEDVERHKSDRNHHGEQTIWMLTQPYLDGKNLE